MCCVQTQGLGTALKILFSEKEIQNLPEHTPSKGFQLTRQEIVALLNGFGRYSRRTAVAHSRTCHCGTVKLVPQCNIDFSRNSW